MSEETTPTEENDDARDLVGDYKAGWHDPETATIRFDSGLSEKVVRDISELKNEPEWMTEIRVKAYHHFVNQPMPSWGNQEMLNGINFDAVTYFLRSGNKTEVDWEDVPEDIKRTFDRLGIPEAEQKWLGGVTAQYESEAVYHSIREDLEAQGVIFLDMDAGLREHEDIVKDYFCTVVPYQDNKFSALNTAVWSGGSFIYVPKGVHVEMPVQAYFRINAKNMGQFERTLIIVDEGASIHYVEGCTAPAYSTESLHSAVVELIAHKGAHIRYSTVQNWSTNVYNLVTKRAVAHENATVEWVDGNIGCLMEGSTVTTPDGVIPIELVEVGDKVLSWNDRLEEFCFREVKAKQFSGYQQVMEVTCGQRSLHTTANHPFYSWTYDETRAKKLGRYELAYVRADNLEGVIVPSNSIDYGSSYDLTLPPESVVTEFTTSNQYQQNLVVQRERIHGFDFPYKTSPNLMWLFGMFIGDGSIEWNFTHSGNPRYAKVIFSVPVEKRGHSRMAEMMNNIVGKNPTIRADGITASWHGIALAQYFELNGFISGARKKRIPIWVDSIPEEQRCSLIAGYLDSDGCAINSSRILQIKSVNFELLKDTARLLTGLGINCRINISNREKKDVEILGNIVTARKSWSLSFDADERILNHCSEEIRSKCASWQDKSLIYHRKVGRSNIVLSPSIEVHKVEVSGLSAEKVPTWDIEVEGTGNFVSQGFIVHNSKLTMKYPAVILKGEGAHAEVISVAYSGKGQHQDAGAKVHHLADRTTSSILSKSISKGGGRGSYRGMVTVSKKAEDCKVNVVCDALILDDESQSDTYPTMEISNPTCRSEHEASVSKVSDEQVFYLMSRGHTEEEAMALIVNGFFEPFTRELPMEYAVELNKLMAYEMEGSIG